MCVTCPTRVHQREQREKFLNEHKDVKEIIAYKVVECVNMGPGVYDFMGMYSYHRYKVGVNEAIGLEGKPCTVVDDYYDKYCPRGIHVYLTEIDAIALEKVPLYFRPGIRWSYKLIKVRCLVEDIICCDGIQAAFTKVTIDEDQLKAPW